MQPIARSTITVAIFVAATMGRVCAQNPPTEDAGDASSLPHGIRDVRDQRDHPTAVELLKSLRRARPMAQVIQPVSAADRNTEHPKLLLLPQGTTVVRRTGTLARTGPWWTFVFDPANGDPPTKLLPNANLELMIRTAAGSSSRFPFLISGEMTVFEDENYMIVRAVQRVRATSMGTAPIRSKGDQADPPNAPGDTPSDAPVNEQLVAEVSVEAALAAIERQQVEPILSIDTQPFDQPGETSGSGMSHLVADGSPLVRRPGRIVRDGPWWTFVFESDHADHPEPPMRLLPSVGAEMMVETHERTTSGLVFLLSGEVTLFRDLLPRFVIRRIDSGNLTE